MTIKNYPSISITQTQPSHSNAIETVLDMAFGLDRLTKTSYRLREGSAPRDGLSHVAMSEGQIIGTIQFWPIIIGNTHSALLLGPLAVLPEFQNAGVGLALIDKGLDAARTDGHAIVVLVGDEPYYAKAGFKRFEDDAVSMPGPFDPERLLRIELKQGAAKRASGLILPPHRVGCG